MVNRFLLLLLAALSLVSIDGIDAATNKSVVDIKAVSGLVLGLKDEFKFDCNTSADYTISLIIDGELGSPKLAQVSNKTYEKGKKVEFRFTDLTANDNGTNFTCGATPVKKTALSNFSDVLVLQVQYPPMFVNGSNVSVLSELPVTKTSKLLCTVSMANPPVTGINFSNNSNSTKNVHTKVVNDSMGTITFEKAIVDNRGLYRCSASNSIGTTTLTHVTFIGGPPDKLSVHPSVNITSDRVLLVSINVTDHSDAPALSMNLTIPGLKIEEVVRFELENEELPVKNQTYTAVKETLTQIEGGNFSLIIEAYNMLGNATVYNETVYIPGIHVHSNVTVNISSSQANVTQGHNYTFMCDSSNATKSFSVLINNSTEAVETRIVEGKKTDESQEFIFTNTTYKDNGTVLQCVADGKYKSNESYVIVLYPPMFIEAKPNVSLLSELPVNETSNLSCVVSMANPPVTGINFSNNSNSTKNVHTKVVNDSMGAITFEKAIVKNRGLYRCSASNSIGTATLTYVTFIGGPPDKLTVHPSVNITDDRVLFVSINVTDHSSAPALSMNVAIPGLKIKELVRFELENEELPVKNQTYTAVKETLTQIEGGNFSLIIEAYNMLGNATVYNETVYIPGVHSNVTVNISSSQANVTQGRNYTFMCNSSNATKSFSVLINNSTEVVKTRIVEGKKTNKSQEFIFTNTTYKDNGTVLQCVADKMYKSNESYVIVLYPPIFINKTQEVTGRNGSDNVTITIPHLTANPPPNNFTWYRNGKKLNSTGRVSIVDHRSLLFNTLLQEDLGYYEVHVKNKIGCANGTLFIDVQWPPYLQEPFTGPTLHANDKSYTISLNISANPDISFTQWLRNGKNINNDTGLILGFKNLTFLSVRPLDNGSYSAIVYNTIGNVTVDFDTMVYYAPVVKISRSSIGSFLNSREVINITVMANPSNYTYEWKKAGKPVKSSHNVELSDDSITFNNISMSDEGKYSLTVNNTLGSANVTFELAVYDGPFFDEGTSNTTLFQEHETDTNVNITCTVKKSVPPVTELKIEPSKGDNWKTVKNGNESVTLVIDKANIKNNSRKFMCFAVNKLTTATLTFDTYIGGVPNRMVVNVTESTKDNLVNLTFTVTDNSDAPATKLLVFLEGIMDKNLTIDLPGYPLNGTSVSFVNAVSEKFDKLGAGEHVVKMYGGNLIGTTFLSNYRFATPSTPSPKPTHPTKKKSSTVTIAIGVTVPVVVILLVIIGGVAGFFYYKKRSKSEYQPLSVQDFGAKPNDGN